MEQLSNPALPNPARRRKFLIGGAIIVLVLVGLILWAMTQPGAASATILPSDLAQQGPGGSGQLRLGGTVVPGSIEREGLATRFLVTDGTTEIHVSTDSPMPDAFKESSEVVATGTYDGVDFTATRVFAKCPSKFKAKV